MDKLFYLVAGLGKTGYSIAHYLKRQNRSFIAFDTRDTIEGIAQFKVDFPNVEIYFHELPSAIYSQIAAIILSPGISLDEPFLVKARSLDIPIYGDIECLAQVVQAPVVAITGTNGKSTVTTLVGEMAKQAGLKVAVAGNIGEPVLNRLNDTEQYDLWVLELSSFQLDLTYSLAPKAAVILNITPDHLDRHHTMDAYIAAKQRVYHHAEVLIHNRQDIQTYPATMPVAGSSLVSYGLDQPVGVNDWGIIDKDGMLFLAHGDHELMPVDQLKIKGKHNWQNALAACALAHAAGVGFDPMITVLSQFSGLPHRCQWVRTLNQVDWINDSKGTNVGATESAIAGIGGAIQGKIVLIVGGMGKGADFSDLRQSMQTYVRQLILIGQDAEIIANDLKGAAPMRRANSFKEAIDIAQSAALPGDVVLLSPACASFDMFRDFNHRGEVFAELVAAL